MFGKKKMSEEESEALFNEINALTVSDMNAAYQRASEAYNQNPEVAAFFLGYCCYIGNPVKADQAAAIQYFKQHLSRYPGRGAAWIYMAVCQENQKDYFEALESYKKAQQYGMENGAIGYARVSYLLGIALSQEVAKTLNLKDRVDSIGQFNNLMRTCIAKYNEWLQKGNSLNVFDWRIFGQAGLALYIKILAGDGRRFYKELYFRECDDQYGFPER